MRLILLQPKKIFGKLGNTIIKQELNPYCHLILLILLLLINFVFPMK